MKKLTLIIVVLIFCQITASSQPCPDSLYITTQAQIDSFQINYPNCTEIEGDVDIRGYDITNLNGLSVLTSIGGYLLFYNNDALTSLIGLDSLTSIGGYFEVIWNSVLTSLTGLEGLTAIGGDLNIYFNTQLTSLIGLDSLTSIDGHLGISGNFSLTILTGLEGLTSIGSSLIIYDNDALTSITGLEGLTSIGDDLNIWGNDALTSLTSLDNVASIGRDFYIVNNNALTSLTGLENVTSFGGSLYITNNDALISLTGLENITSIGGELDFFNNDALTSLTGIDNIEAASIINIEIWDNDSLNTCEVLSICDYLASPGGTILIKNNAPGCNSPEEVQDSCITNGVSINEQNIKDNIVLYPNPAHQELNISFEGYDIDEVTIYTLTGQQILQDMPVIGAIDISDLQPGMYIVEVTIENSKLRQKLLIQR